MSLDLTTHDIDAIVAATQQHSPPVTSSDQVETIYAEPPQLGRGHTREIELCSGLELSIFDVVPHDLTARVPENEHLVQFSALLSGVCDCGDHLQINAHQSYIGGSGIQPRHFTRYPRSHRQVGVDIHMTPALFQQFFANIHGELPVSLQPLVQGNDWQHRFSPPMTGAMRTVVQQMIDCPFLGTAKQAYLQGKVFELIALQLDGMVHGAAELPSATLKPDTIARIHYAAEILRSHLEHPPNQTALSQQVGVSDRTLQKGFKAVFGMTPFAYLTRQRMQQADQLLRQPGQTVTQVANIVGYTNPAQFAAAFKRQFGKTPRECLSPRRQ